MEELLKQIGTPYKMFFEDTNYLGCFFPIYFLHPNAPRFPLKFDSNNHNYIYGMRLLKHHCIEITRADLKAGDIIATEFRGELHVAVFYEFDKVIHVFKDHNLQIGRLSMFKEFKCFRVVS